MQLKLAIHPIREICFGENTRLDRDTLFVAKAELRKVALELPVLESVDFEIVRPGESCRAGPVFDIVEPRAKAPGGSPDWPGVLSAPQTAGRGTTHVLHGAAVTLLREQSPGESRGATGYVLEMSGAAARVRFIRRCIM
jgi:glycine reductase